MSWHKYKDGPLSEEELQRARLTQERMDQAWPILGPVVAAVSNWKAWVAIVLMIVWLNNPKIIAALATLTGGE